MLHQLRRIVISRTDKLGDVVMSLPVFASIRECFPECELTALVQNYTSEVVSSFPAVDRVAIYDPLASLASAVRTLRATKADAILFLYPRFTLALAAILAGIPVRVGTAYRWFSFLYNKRVREHRKDSVKSEAEYNLALARAIGCEARRLDINLNVGAEALESARNFIVSNGLDKFVVVHPGSRGSAADWSASGFRKVCESLVRESDVDVVVTGSKEEKALCDSVSTGITRCVNASGVFELREFIAFISLAAAFVSNSTGPIHLAAAVGTPVVGIYPNSRPMTPARWAPLTQRKIILTPHDGSDDLSRVDPSDVVKAIATFVSVRA